MIRLEKGPKPSILAEHEQKWTEDFLAVLNRGEKASDTVRFRYRHRDIKQAIRDESFDKCIYCESKFSHVSPGQMDHILPVSRRADLAFNWDNLGYVCEECNRSKHDYFDPAEPLINPFTDEPDKHLVFFGPLVLHVPNDSKGLRTRIILKLSRGSLVERKKERIESVQRLDLLRKSDTETELEVVDTGDEVEAQVEAFAPTAVTLTEDAKNFEFADDPLDTQTKAGQDAVRLLFLVGERVMLGGFGRQTGVRVQLVESQVAAVGEHDGVGMNVGRAFFEQAEVMRSALTKSGGDDFTGFPVQEHLSFQGVPFLLTAIAPPLFFWAARPAFPWHQPPRTTAQRPQPSGWPACQAA